MATDHYQVLGISRVASSDEIRVAYRYQARLAHPDTPNGSAEQMRLVNEAWHVLSDPGRRALYDSDLRDRENPGASTSSKGFTNEADGTADFVYVAPIIPAKFPWRFVTWSIVLGVAVVLILGAFASDPAEPRPDNLLQSGSCVNIDQVGMAVETLCTQPHDAVVDRLIAIDAVCPSDTETVPDKQGMGRACIRRVLPQK